MILYVMILNGKRYLTTSLEAAWQFCTCFDILIEEILQSTRVIDGVEYQEQSLEDIYKTIKRICAPVIKGFKGHLVWENGNRFSRVVAKESNDGNFFIGIDPWVKSPRQHNFFPAVPGTLVSDAYGHIIITARQHGRKSNFHQAMAMMEFYKGCFIIPEHPDNLMRNKGELLQAAEYYWAIKTVN